MLFFILKKIAPMVGAINKYLIAVQILAYVISRLAHTYNALTQSFLELIQFTQIHLTRFAKAYPIALQNRA